MIGKYLPVRCAAHGKVQEIRLPSEMEVRCPNGGCDMPCPKVLSCGHQCDRKCHPVDDHKEYQCQVTVEKACPRSKHIATKICSEDFGQCGRMLLRNMPCGHIADFACHLADESLQCRAPCDRPLACGHYDCKKLCHQACSICTREVFLPFPRCPFNHQATVHCRFRAEFEEERPNCQHPCPELLSCGHHCTEVCGDACTFQCIEAVDHQCPGCGQRMEKPCFEEPDDVRCDLCTYMTSS
ncbi:unnamed protein product, partial [Mesorhabditis spiculigera]